MQSQYILSSKIRRMSIFDVLDFKQKKRRVPPPPPASRQARAPVNVYVNKKLVASTEEKKYLSREDAQRLRRLEMERKAMKQQSQQGQVMKAGTAREPLLAERPGLGHDLYVATDPRGQGLMRESRSHSSDTRRKSQRTEENEQELLRSIQELSVENVSLKQRLNQYMSAQLRADNPDFVDLRDSNTPIKLAEKYRSLYDNEWTSAFDELQNGGLQETEAIQYLLHAFQFAYEYCKQTARQQEEALTMTVMQDPDPGQMDTMVIQGLKEFRKSTCIITIKNLKQNAGDFYKNNRMGTDMLHAKFLDPQAHEDCRAYLEGCIELAWQMFCNFPPVHVGFEPVTQGMSFNTERYAAYTRTGKEIQFIVWPVLCLYEGGPVLSKGIAQGK